MTLIFQAIQTELYSRAKTPARFVRMVTDIVESTSAYVLDGESAFQELEGCEKSIFGVKFEKRFTRLFRLPRKRVKHNALLDVSTKLDTVICGYDIDIKTTLGGKTWMIPNEARDQWCLLLQVDYQRSQFSLGILFMSSDVITVGVNQDKKASVNASGVKAVEWLIKSAPFVYGHKPSVAGLLSWV